MRISLEFAHTNLAEVARGETLRSVEAASIVLRHLRAQGHEVTTVVLLDDKKVPRENAEPLSKDLLSLLAEFGCYPDAWYYERELKHHLPALGELLPRAPRRALDRATNSYLRKYDSLPCSVDIAIWHALQIGLIVDPRVTVADVAVSLLADVQQEYETLARRNILTHIDGASRRVIDLYYPESADASFDAHGLLVQLTTALKEPTACPAS